MANKTDERLLDSFREASGRQTGGLEDLRSVAGGLTEAMGESTAAEVREPTEAPGATGVTKAMMEASGRQTGSQDDLRSVADDITRAMGESTAAEATPAAAGGNSPTAQGQTSSDLYAESGTPVGSSEHSSSTTDTGSGFGSSIGSIATTFLESGLGIVPLVTGLMGLFGGGSTAPPALEKYSMPSSIAFESADTGNGLSASDFDQMGTPRLYGSAADSPDTASGGAAAGSSVAEQGGGTSGGGGNAAGPQISVTVQTMDAQSFLDNSDQIARAVRGAMLNLSSINDVVNEL